MMQTQTYAHVRTQPRRRDIFLHIGKTLKLISGLMTDRRVPIWRKLLFVGSIVALLALMFFPDFFSEAFLSVVLPIVGTVVGVPVDAGMDWIAFALLAVNLLKFFPAAMVGEYYTNIFGK